MSTPNIKIPEVSGSVYEQVLLEKARRSDAKPETVRKFREDPLGFVMWNWRWGLPGPLERFQGPDLWQKEFLIDLAEQVRRRAFNGRDAVEPIRMTVSAGQGPGKGALMSWLVSWIMSTRPYAQGTVTANTFTQLETKTWAAIEHWFKTGRTAKDFLIGSNGIKHRQHQKSWMCTPQTCKEENSEAFAGQHAATSTSFYCNDEACHDDKTEVLSRRGWLFFKDVMPTDELLTKSPETHIAEYVRPLAVHSSWMSGDLFSYKVRGADFLVTGNHQMFHRPKDGRNGGLRPWRFESMDKLSEKSNAHSVMSRTVIWEAPDIETFTIPGFKSRNKTRPPRVVNFDDWVKFLGWYGSEGHTEKRINAAGGLEFISVGISNTDVSEARDICSRMGFKPYTYANGKCWTIKVHDRALAEYLGWFGKNCLEKTIPPCVGESSRRQINLFLDAYVKGDGYRNGNRDVIYTSSKRMADVLQELCIKGGSNSTLSTRSLMGKTNVIGDHTATSSCDGYVITRPDKPTDICVRTKYIKPVHYEGYVYCAELPKHHLLFTRRNGLCLWSGNSAIPEKIWQVEEGGLSDGEPMLFAFGNATRSSGKFYRINFGDEMHRWNHRVIDSRDCMMPNKKLIQEWIEDYGEDSDFVRVRVKGLPPRAGDMQYIPSDSVYAAQKRLVEVIADEPLIAGVDLARGGGDNAVVRFRRGDDARSIPAVVIPGELVRDSSLLVAKLADMATQTFGGVKVHTWFLDGGGIGGPIIDRLVQLGHRNMIEVQFGGQCPDPRHFANMRSWMWSRMREALGKRLAIDKDRRLEMDLTNQGLAIGAGANIDRLVLESKESMKKRGLDSPDQADALCLTWAHPVGNLPRSFRDRSKDFFVSDHDGNCGWMA